MSHIAEQMFSIHIPAVLGYRVFFTRGKPQFIEDLHHVKPTFLFGAPRVWEKFFAALSAKLPAGVPVEKLPQANKSAMLGALGLTECKLAVTGAAPIARKILVFFDSLGLPIREVYGQSEVGKGGGEGERERVCVCVCVCVWMEIDRQTDRRRERERREYL